MTPAYVTVHISADDIVITYSSFQQPMN